VTEHRGSKPRVVIIGSGFGGLCLAIRLKMAGVASFTILEKADRVGGTWRDNVYPGAACDCPSFAYSFSFEPSTDWSRKWAPQPEILRYIERCADKYGLLPHCRFGVEVLSARFDEEARVWRIRTRAGEEIEADILVSAVGQLNRPHVPTIRGLPEFEGPAFHSASWAPGFEPDGKTVAVIGSAATAVQLVPALASRVKELHVFQRSPNWIVPKKDVVYSRRFRNFCRRFPLFALLYRWWLWLAYEAQFLVIRESGIATRRAMQIATAHLDDQVPDPALRRTLTPHFPIGAKRILISDDYYPALQRENVRLVTESIDRITREGVVTTGGRTCPVDAILFATGFETTSFLAPMDITGVGKRSLDEAWAAGAEAHLGISVSGFPNFFIMYGPNTNLGHNSIVFMLECQARYIVECLRQMVRRGLGTIDLRPEVQASYNERIRAELDRTVWARVERSWYKNGSGRIVNNWPGSTVEYWWRTRRVDLTQYLTVPLPVASAPRAEVHA